MSNIWRYLAILVAFVSVVSCNKSGDNDSNEEPQLSVNYKTVESVWQLQSIDGMELSESTYFYIQFIQKDQEYKVYENLNSSFARYELGDFNIDLSEYGAYCEISGSKPFKFHEEWSESYYVTSLTASTMVWKGVNFEEELIFTRGADVVIPEEVLNGTKSAL